MFVTAPRGLLAAPPVILLTVFVSVFVETILVMVESDRGARSEPPTCDVELLLSTKLEVMLLMGDRRLLKSITIPIFLKLCCSK
ncbi:hypothetical protein PJ15_2712 [Acinetobacter sp. neg1]|nr:hypothetical protein PJ15_2712 [Acinetobacter sp. neg1]